MPTATAVPLTTEPLLARATENGQVYLGDDLLLDIAAEDIGCFGVGAIDYSPMGDHFVVIFDCFEGDNEAFLFQDDGSGKQRVTGQWDYVNYHQYEWSPDGRFILFLSEQGNSINSGVYVMNADGSDVRLLYNSTQDKWGAVWSADGSQIAFTIDQPGGTADIYMMQADGGNAHLVIERDSYPSWGRP